MLATRTHTFLSRHRPLIRALFNTQKGFLKLVHARIGEQQRGVVYRDQRARRDSRVTLRLKIAQEGFANIGSVHAVFSDSLACRRRGRYLGKLCGEFILPHWAASKYV